MRVYTLGDRHRLVCAYDNAGRVAAIRYVNECVKEIPDAFDVPLLLMRALKDLDIDNVRMVLRAPFNGVLSLVSHALIEPWGLEAVCRQNNLNAAAGDSLGLGRAKE